MNGWCFRCFCSTAVQPRFEIGEKTGLSAQTVSVIVRSLEQEGLVTRGEGSGDGWGRRPIPMGP